MIATADELATFLGVAPYTGAALEQAELALDLAEGIIKAELDQALAEVIDDTVTLAGTGGTELLLPELPVTEVTDVTVNDPADADPLALTADEDYIADLGDDGRRGILRRRGTRWPGPTGTITVTYTHGYADGTGYAASTMPPALKAVALTLAVRAKSNPAGLTQETVGRWSGAYGGRGFDLTAADKLVLERFLPGRRA